MQVLPYLTEQTSPRVNKMFITKLHPISNGVYAKARTTHKPKICKDCKHYDHTEQTCKLFQATDLVTGEAYAVLAVAARESSNMCGHGGALFQHCAKQ